jgi:trimethyllysine dioxygenase
MASDKGVADWTSKIVLPSPTAWTRSANKEQRKFGFCFVDGCPISPEKTQALLERISFIRPTHYG